MTRPLTPTRQLTVLAALTVAALVLGTHAPASATPTASETPELVVVLDSSGSMAEADAGNGQTRMAAAKQAVTDLATSTPSTTRIGLRTYGDGVDSQATGSCEDTTLRVPVGPVDRDALTAQVDELTPRGDTPIGTALLAAADDFTGAGPQSVVLVSDGEPTCDPDPCPVAAQLAEQGIDLRIDVIGFRVDDDARQVLECIAESGNGQYVDATDATELAQALDTSALRAFRGYVAVGEPVAGTPTPDGAPQLAEGRWLDATTPDSGNHYLMRPVPGGTLHVGATVSPPPGSRDNVVGGLIVRVLGADGVQCVSSTDSYRLADGNAPLSTSVVVDGEQCAGDELVLKVEGPSSSAGAPLELTVVAEPPVLDGAATADPVDPDTTYPEPAAVPPTAEVRGGAGFGLATLMEPGGYEDLIRPGENAYYRVSLAWGQQLAVRAELPEQAVSDPVPRPSYIGVEVYNQVNGRITPLGDSSRAFTDVDDALASLWTTTHPVRWANRQATAHEVRGASLPGDVIIRLALSSNGTVGDEEAATVPVQLSVAVIGEPADGPAYAEPVAGTPAASAAPSPPASSSVDPSVSPSAQASPAEEVDAAPAASGPGPLLPVLLTLAAVLLVALLGLIGYGVRASRRSKALH